MIECDRTAGIEGAGDDTGCNGNHDTIAKCLVCACAELSCSLKAQGDAPETAQR